MQSLLNIQKSEYVPEDQKFQDPSHQISWYESTEVFHAYLVSLLS